MSRVYWIPLNVWRWDQMQPIPPLWFQALPPTPSALFNTQPQYQTQRPERMPTQAEIVQKEVHTMMQQGPNSVGYITDRWNYADLNAKQAYFDQYLKPKMYGLSVPKWTNPDIRTEMLMFNNVNLNNIQIDPINHGFILTIPVSIDLRSTKWYNDPNSSAQFLVNQFWLTQFLKKNYNDQVKK